MNGGFENVRSPWNKGKLIGQRLPLKAKEIWAVRFRLQLEHRIRDLALFNLGIDSKLRGCDLVTLRVRDVAQGGRVGSRAIVMQQKTQRPVNLRSPSKLGTRSEHGFAGQDFGQTTFCSRAESLRPRSSHSRGQGTGQRHPRAVDVSASISR
jgi:hypothetical protein